MSNIEAAKRESGMRTHPAPPSPEILIESMRDIGYSLETALADIIDNSISANATRIELFADSGTATIGVLDDGTGMSFDELLSAMTPGSRSPKDKRARRDLGRFGLGLKTASFSQCKRLTVATERDGKANAAIWDLDHVASTKEWLVQVPEDMDAIPWRAKLGSHGTLVVWECLDRIIDEQAPDGGIAQFVGRMDEARRHLELVFHRFLSGDSGTPKVEILLNNRALTPLDPFCSRHPATVIGPIDTIKVGESTVTIQTFTLPHHRKVSQDEWERAAGADGYLKNQGFYVYREKRLIIYGTWFGLAKQAELTKLARVRIDIPNDLDSAWKIDVKKASAQPPLQVRNRLRRIIDTIGATSKRVYTTRGSRRATDSRLPVWNRLQDKGEIEYAINPEHPAINDFASRLPSGLTADFRKILEIAASTLPLDMIFADIGNTPDSIGGRAVSEDTLEFALRPALHKLLGAGIPADDVVAMLQVTEPFRSNWSLSAGLITRLCKGVDRDDDR